LNSTFELSTDGVQTFVSFHSLSETKSAGTEKVEFGSHSIFFTSMTSPTLTIN
jgi:hypothetical protein